MRPAEVRALAWDEWAMLREGGVAAEAEGLRHRFVEGAFIAWQQGAGGKANFGEYLSKLGLAEGKRRASKLQARAALDDAARIAAADRRQQQRRRERDGQPV